MEISFEQFVYLAGRIMEGAGILVIVGGGALASGRVLLSRQPDRYRRYRQALGRALLLGLEFLVAADVIGTVSTEPSPRNVAVLAGIVLIRTFLSFSLELEIDGRWPWQEKAQA